MFNEIFVAVISAFQGEKKADKNGVINVWLTPVAGKVPNRAMVVAGTVAAQAGLEIGKTLMIMVTETQEPDPQYGRRFNHTVLGEVKPSEILGLRKELGAALVIDVTAGAENTSGIVNNAGAASNVPVLKVPNTSGLPEGSEEPAEEKAGA